jgi:hypothetical protein
MKLPHARLRVAAKWLARLFTVLMCRVQSDARFFYAKEPLFVTVSQPTIGFEK